MRLVILTALSALALGLLAVSGASAMPANGVAINQAASAGQFAQPVWWRYRRWHRWHYHYWWRRWLARAASTQRDTMLVAARS